MARITIEVPEALAERLVSVRDRLPEVLARWLDQPPPSQTEVYRYILEFLASNPSPQTVMGFKPTPAMQERISELLEKNRTDQLTAAESAELDEYVYINDLITLLKTSALRDLQTASNVNNPPNWDDHFQLNADGAIASQTPEGRVTVRLLRFNDPIRVRQRANLIAVGKLIPQATQS